MKMSGNEEHTLNIFLGKNIIANLYLVEDKLYLEYTKYWQSNGYSISPHLLINTDIPSINVQRFLRNLLPEGVALDELINNFHISKFNTFALINALGLDTPGSLVFTAKSRDMSQETSFRIVSNDELETRLANRGNTSLIFWDGKPRLSVAGVQDKINIVVNSKNQMGFGEGELCSTHILKFEKQKTSNLVINEYISMNLAKKCGLSVANTELKRYGNHPALLVKRFDRRFISERDVRRRHIIDGCQALNLPPEFKYERNFGSGRDVAHIRDGASLEKIFKFTEQCENPALCKQQLLDWVIFNILIFNSDAHGKNISFYVGKSGISLAPFYDLVNIKIYDNYEHDFAMAIGDEFDGEEIYAYQLADFADSCCISRNLVSNRLKYIIKNLQVYIDDLPNIKLNKQEINFTKQYQQIVKERCKKFLNFAAEINSIEL